MSNSGEAWEAAFRRIGFKLQQEVTAPGEGKDARREQAIRQAQEEDQQH
jgi:hypothetical protein